MAGTRAASPASSPSWTRATPSAPAPRSGAKGPCPGAPPQLTTTQTSAGATVLTQCLAGTRRAPAHSRSATKAGSTRLAPRMTASGPGVPPRATTNHKWRYCGTAAAGGNSDSSPCVFPFIYKGNTYHSCTAVNDKMGRPWCATTPNYDKDHLWRFCLSKAYGGNSNGQRCTFPFVYKNQLFHSCTNAGDKMGNFWCATTHNYDQDKLWSYCPDIILGGNAAGKSCAFPFLYNKKMHHTCTSDGESSGKLWCSTTRNYDVDKKWTYCSMPDYDKPCVFPFIYKKFKFHTCTNLGGV
ncbi:matrix metalloproteinase-9-like [Natator depressus]|uniref:matrix metalloproteinase-9-like n=1 Tax=Natator depressus TaxID=27790 RepID=UPI003EC11B1D